MKTNEQFIEQAKKIHGNKYDYSKVEYHGGHVKICIICPIHGEFWQTPAAHLSGSGCKKCAFEKISKNNKMTTEEFIEKARKIHGNKYDYSKIDYKGINEYITIICPVHGEFKQKASYHLNCVTGCPKCGIKKSHTIMTTEEYIEKAKKVHGNKYNYSKTEYKDMHTKICIICPEHGEFWQNPANHLRGFGCKKCGYSSIAKSRVLTKEEFLKKAMEIHGDKYDLSNVNYISTNTPIIVGCKKHGDFIIKPQNFLKGSGCQKCACTMNMSELKLYEDLKIKYPNYNITYHYSNKKIFGRKSIDIFINDLKIAIEYQGVEHFKPVNFFGGLKEFISRCNRDKKKYEECKMNGITILYYTVDKYVDTSNYIDKVYTKFEDLCEVIDKSINNKNS